MRLRRARILTCRTRRFGRWLTRAATPANPGCASRIELQEDAKAHLCAALQLPNQGLASDPILFQKMKNLGLSIIRVAEAHGNDGMVPMEGLDDPTVGSQGGGPAGGFCTGDWRNGGGKVLAGHYGYSFTAHSCQVRMSRPARRRKDAVQEEGHAPESF